MAKECKGKWNLKLTPDGGSTREDGHVVIEQEDAQGNFKGKHTSTQPKERPVRNGKCKNEKVSFDREHEDGGTIFYNDGSFVSEKKLEGRYRISASNLAAETEGDDSEADRDRRKDKNKGKTKPPAPPEETGTWTGSKDGL